MKKKKLLGKKEKLTLIYIGVTVLTVIVIMVLGGLFYKHVAGLTGEMLISGVITGLFMLGLVGLWYWLSKKIYQEAMEELK